MIGTNSFAMKHTQLMTNRWEALVPVEPFINEMRYRIKVNWKYNAIPTPAANSQLSEEFLLRINN
jgi:hypothetical protein